MPASNFSFNLAAPIEINGSAPVSMTSSQDQTITWNGSAYDSNAILQLSVSQNLGYFSVGCVLRARPEWCADDSGESACAIQPGRNRNLVGVGNGIGCGNSGCEFRACRRKRSVDAGEPGEHRYASGGLQMKLLVSGGVFLALASLLPAQTATVRNAASFPSAEVVYGDFLIPPSRWILPVSFAEFGYSGLVAPVNVIAPGMLAVLTYSQSGGGIHFDEPVSGPSSATSYSPVILTIRPSGSSTSFQGRGGDINRWQRHLCCPARAAPSAVRKSNTRSETSLRPGPT